MKLDKFQVDALKALLKNPASVSYWSCDDGHTLVCLHGYVAAKIFDDDLQLKLIDAQMSLNLRTAWDVELDRPGVLLPTDEYRRGGTAQKFLYGGDATKPVYIDTKYLAYFQPDQLVQPAYNPKGLVYVIENQNPVGIIAPVNIKEE